MQLEESGTALMQIPSAADARRDEATPKKDAMLQIEQHPAWAVLSGLLLRLSTEIPMHGFRVRDLLRLQKGCILESRWQASSDVPLRVHKVEAAWCEFEVVERKVSVRITRLA